MPRLPSHFWYAIVAFTIFAIYFNTPQHLHICKEQICAHPFFRPVATTGREIRKRRQNIVWYKARKKFPPNFTSLLLTSLFVRGQNRIDPSSSSTIPKRIGIFEFAKL